MVDFLKLTELNMIEVLHVLNIDQFSYHSWRKHTEISLVFELA